MRSRSVRRSLQRFQPAERDEESVSFGERLRLVVVAVEEAVFLTVEAVQFATAQPTARRPNTASV
jgi:hypothetical protein